MAKKKTKQQELDEHRTAIIERIDHWKDLNENGGSDPCWADGTNMNLVRNHVIYHKKQILEICEEIGSTLPGEYYIPAPPKVDNDYMASLNQTERVERLRMNGHKPFTASNHFDDSQLSLF